MKYDKNTAVDSARRELSHLLGIDIEEISVTAVEERDFPDMSLGAPVEDEMAAQMITTGCLIKLRAKDKAYQYRADKYQLRLVDFEGNNYVVSA